MRTLVDVMKNDIETNCANKKISSPKLSRIVQRPAGRTYFVVALVIILFTYQQIMLPKACLCRTRISKAPVVT